MKNPCLHEWRVGPRDAVEIQRRLAKLVDISSDGRPIRYVAGVDVSYCRQTKRCTGAVVLWDMKTRDIVEEQVVSTVVEFPYVPGLLSFREAPVVLAALEKIQAAPDALLCDGQGIAHPRRLGIASHLGVLTGIPSVGCAKSRLIGEHGEPGRERGSCSPLIHRGETIGAVVRTRSGVKPVFVSPGHKVDLDKAVEIVLSCSLRFRLPEPIRLADRLAGRDCFRED